MIGVWVLFQVCFYFVEDVFMIESNMGLCLYANVLFICCVCLLRIYMGNHIVFSS
jgi:hypothetical protein